MNSNDSIPRYRHKHPPRDILTTIPCLFLALSIFYSPAPSHAAPPLHEYDSRYYTIHTDLDPDSEREADLRLTKMADEYHQRTTDFAGAIHQKLPVYLYRHPEDYYTDGGLPNTAGVFIADPSHSKLLALAGDNPTAITWHTLQHEAFHQFAHAVISPALPPSLDEGLAEYFGEGIFTGDGFVIGVIPSWRLQRLKESITSEKLKPLPDFLTLTPQQWQTNLTLENYDQAWSLVHFLIHANAGQYRANFNQCIRQLAAHQPFEKAPNLESRWKTYWLSQPPNPSAILYTQAAVATLTSYLARATAQGQTFDSFNQFQSTAKIGKLKSNPADWLPPNLLAHALQSINPATQWTLNTKSPNPTLSATMPDGTQITSSYHLQSGRVSQVEAKITLENP